MRANYVLAENGSWRLFYSHWAATTIHLDVIGGPEAATRFVAGQSEQPRDETAWLDDVWCEGAALIDHDRKRLVFFTSHLDGYAEQLAALAALGRTWAGWEVRWAYDGLGDIVAYLGLDRAMVRAGDQEPNLTAAEDDFLECVLTVRSAEGVAAYALDSGEDGTDLLDLGPEALEALPKLARTSSVDYTPNSGVHLDLRDQTAGFWTSQTMDGAFERAPARWPGWTWTFWENRSEEQLGRSDGAITWPAPDLTAALRSLATHVESHADHDPLRTARGFVERMEQQDKNVEVSSYFYEHTNVPLTPDERAAVQATIAQLVAESPAGR
jgi:hypothetical protein